MKKQILLLLIFTAFLASCNDKIVIKIDECEEYYRFIKKTWAIDSNNIYYFKGYPDYWKGEQHKICIKEKCIMGLTKKEIIALFGTPTKEYKFKYIDGFYYCMDPKCRNITGDTANPAGLRIDFSDDRVVFFLSYPLDIIYN